MQNVTMRRPFKLFVIAIGWPSLLCASNLLVQEENGASVDGKSFKQNFQQKKNNRQIKRLKYEKETHFKKRRKQAEMQFEEILEKEYRATIHDLSVSYDWSAGHIMYTANTQIPMKFDGEARPTKKMSVGHDINDALGQEIAAFPDAVRIEMQIEMTEHGYANVLDYTVYYRDLGVYDE